MAFKQHTDDIKTKAKNRLDVIRSLTHSHYLRALQGRHYKNIQTVHLTNSNIRTHSVGALTLQNTRKQTTDHTKHGSPNRYRLHKIHPTPTNSRGNPSPPSPLLYGHERHTHLHIHSRSTASLHFMQNLTQTRRNIHLTHAHHYHTLHNALPPVPDDSSVRTNIHTEFTRKALDSLPPWYPATRCLRDGAYAGPLAAGATGVIPVFSQL